MTAAGLDAAAQALAPKTLSPADDAAAPVRADAAPEDARPIRIKVRGLSKIFGPANVTDKAVALAGQGASREDIRRETGCVVGLHDVSFDVREGEILVVMGLSGSGKSTTLRCLNRLIDPTAGQVTVDGVEVNALGQDELIQFRRKTFGMVFQQFALFPHRSILANVGYGLEVQGVAKPERDAKAKIAIDQVGLSGFESARPAQLSGGMQQRAGLARALAVDPDILLMDEAFSALDPLIRRDMQRQLAELQLRLKKTIVFVSHDLDEAIALGGRIVLMKDGMIVQSGMAIDLLTNPADEYVRRFVEHIDVLGVLTAERSMTPALGLIAVDGERRPLGCATVPAGATLRQALGTIEKADGPVAVVCSEGRTQGALTKDSVMTALARRTHGVAPTAA